MLIRRIKHDGVIHYNVDPESTTLPATVIQQALLDQAWSLVRKQRDSLLRNSDYAVMPDYPLTDAQKADVTAYRQALRDIPETFATPDAVEWPTKPEAMA
jgi:hypothetical protein